jgi:hypothetical protein
MKDILHKVNIENNNFVCLDCGVEIPADIAILGDDVIELGGAGTHWLPGLAYEGKAKPCLKATRGLSIVVCIICEGDGCEECGFNGVISSDGSKVSAQQSEPTNGEIIESAPPKTEHEKMVARMGLQNFVNMREVTKPDGA